MAIAFLLAIALIIPSVSYIARADENSDARAAYEEKLKAAKELREQYERSKSQAASLIDEYNRDIESAKDYIADLDMRLNELSEAMFELNDRIENTEKELARTQAELERLQIERAELYELIKNRVKYTYEAGETTYIEVLLGSGSISDLLNRIEYIKTIHEYDNGLLDDYQEKTEQVQLQEQLIIASLEELNLMKEQCELDSATIEELVAIKGDEINELVAKVGVTEELLFTYTDQINSTDTAIDNIVKAEEERLAEIERKRKEEEERLRREAEELARKQAERAASQEIQALLDKAEMLKSGNLDIEAAKEKMAKDVARRRTLYQYVSYDSDAINHVVLTDNTDPKTMIWPLPGDKRVYSAYGYRYTPNVSGATSFHEGWDIGGKYGAPIVAALAGKVIKTGYDYSAGNFIRIDHGNGFVTRYYHTSKILVSEGDYVQQGQKIALVGSTGASTGSHLHFGLMYNGIYIDPEPFLGPLD